MITRAGFISGTAASVAALSGMSRAAIPLAVPARHELSGILFITAQSAKYNASRMDFNARINEFPALIAYCRTARDVQRVIRYANARNLRLSVRAGAHDFEGYSLNTGGVVIDLSLMSGVQKTGNLLLVQPGTSLERFYAWSVQNGVTLPGGTCPSVGAAGLCSGGGFGFLSPWNGLFCDRLRRVQLIDADGNLRDSANDPDLLWASQGGGGGNFGVTVGWHFEPVPIPKNLVTFGVTWPWSAPALRSALHMFFAWTTGKSAPYYLSFSANARPSGGFELKGLGIGDLSAVRSDVLAHLGSTGGKFSTQKASFSDVVEFFGGERPHKRAKAKTHLGHAMPAATAIDAMVFHLKNAPGPSDSVELDTFGDAITAVASDATAFPHRNMRYILLHRAQWDKPADDAAHERWVRALYDAVDPYMPRASYRNFSDRELADWQFRYYGHNYARLRRIKARLDPHNRLRYAQSIS